MPSLIHPKEKLYFAISVIVSILIYFLLVLSVIGIFYLIIGALVGLIVQGLAVGHLRGNGIRVSEKQFPEVHQLAQEIAAQMELRTMPPIYIIQSGGVLNAFAMRFLGRNYVAVYSEILELAFEQGKDALGFIISHEFAHIKRNHLNWRWVLLPSTFIPFLSQAYSRACEYSCDLIAAHTQPAGATAGILVLAAGKKLYLDVNTDDYLAQATKETGFWIWFSEILSSHPNLPRRIMAINQSTTLRTEIRTQGINNPV
ncbi:MAG: peptidase [Anaerosporomusa subterranea]|jgi:Zn-dependent protease with chaperone function|nr:peptidase [Anaerosporomusa subterranea]